MNVSRCASHTLTLVSLISGPKITRVARLPIRNRRFVLAQRVDLWPTLRWQLNLAQRLHVFYFLSKFCIALQALLPGLRLLKAGKGKPTISPILDGRPFIKLLKLLLFFCNAQTEYEQACEAAKTACPPTRCFDWNKERNLSLLQILPTEQRRMFFYTLIPSYIFGAFTSLGYRFIILKTIL